MNSFENSSPVYLQIAEKLATQIFGGKLVPGAQLPSVREIAATYRVNPNTVQKALAKLEEESLIVTKRTNGKYVTELKELIMEEREKYAEELTRTYEQKMHEVGAEIRMPKIMWINENAAEILERVEEMEEMEEKPKDRSRRWFF